MLDRLTEQSYIMKVYATRKVLPEPLVPILMYDHTSLLPCRHALSIQDYVDLLTTIGLVWPHYAVVPSPVYTTFNPIHSPESSIFKRYYRPV